MLTYPQIFPTKDQYLNGPCRVSDVGKMSPDDVGWVHDTWSAFNTVIKQAATGISSVQILDEEHAFDGHTVCDAAPDANGVVLSDINTSFHPNSYGDSQLAFDIEYLLRLP